MGPPVPDPRGLPGNPRGPLSPTSSGQTRSGAELTAHSSAPAPTCDLCAEPGAAHLGGCRPGPGPPAGSQTPRGQRGRDASARGFRSSRRSVFSSVYLALSFLREGGGCPSPLAEPWIRPRINPRMGGGPFVPLPDVPPGLSADGFRPGWQTFPAPSRPSRGKGPSAKRGAEMQLQRGLAAGRRAISRGLLPFRVQLRLPRFPSPPRFQAPSSSRAAARDLGSSDSLRRVSDRPSRFKTRCPSRPESYLSWKRKP